MPSSTILKLFNRVLLVPVELARKIGVERACLLASLIREHGLGKFEHISDLYLNDSIDYLFTNNFLIRDSDGVFINYDKIESLFIEKSLKEFNPPFKSTRFISLCEEWRKVLKSKNRPKTLHDIYKLFEGKKEEEAIKALQYAVDNKYVSLFYESEKSTRADSSGRRTWSSGGGKNSTERTDDNKLIRRPT